VILPEDIARVRAATDFVSVASEHIALKRVGRRWVGLCPFHAEKTPSFSVNAEEGLYYCFGCGVGGDAISFVQHVEHLEFAEAVERLAARAGVQVRYDNEAVSRDRQRRARLVEVMERAVEWYHRRLLSGPDAAAARAYLRSRGYDGDVVRTYRLGWAPDAWDELCRALAVDDEMLRDTGLGVRNRLGRQQDVFRARVMFPIFDVRGDPVAFGGRALQGGPPPKYRNSAETPLYSKSRVLYGLNWAKAAVVEAGEVVVCEGYTDVIGFATAGVPRAVATCGTALADEHFRVLKNFARRVVLAYDADAAGVAAAERFYEWEKRYEVDIRVADLPAGADPGGLAQTDPAALRAAVDNAPPFLGFRLGRALSGADLRTPEGRARAAEAGMAVIREHPGELVRDQYLMQLADRVRIPADRLRRLAAGPAPASSGERRRTETPPRPERAVVVRDGPEVEALRVAVHRPEAVADRLHDVLFPSPVARAAYRALCSAPTLHEALEAADATDTAAAALLRRLAVEDADVDADDVVARLAEEAAKRTVIDLESTFRSADDPMAYAADLAWLKLTMEELHADRDTAVEATGRLVRWLVSRFEVDG
jgi:DNA primase